MNKLASTLRPIYLVSGDEPLLRQEYCEQLRALAKFNGYHERQVFQVGKEFSWDRFLSEANNQSLFSEKILLELQLLDAKLGNAGSQAIQTYCQKLPADKILLIIIDKLDGQSKQAKWYKAINSIGTITQIWPPTSAQLPNWISQRLRQADLSTSPSGLKLLAEFSEGNLLAAAQEINKLQLLYGSGNISEEQIAGSISDNARFNIFIYADAFLAGDAAKTLRVLRNLHQEKTEPVLILWALTKELRNLAAIHRLKQRQNLSLEAAMQQQYIRETRKNLVKTALQKYTSKDIQGLLKRCAHLDRVIKGAEPGNIWQELENLL